MSRRAPRSKQLQTTKRLTSRSSKSGVGDEDEGESIVSILDSRDDVLKGESDAKGGDDGAGAGGGTKVNAHAHAKGDAKRDVKANTRTHVKGGAGADVKAGAKGNSKPNPSASPSRSVSKSSPSRSNPSATPSAFESYNSHLFTSSCCHQFNIHEGPMCICSQCKRLITQLKDDEVLTVSVKFNNSLESNVSADIQNSFKLKAKRFATDPTYELCGRKCPKCKSLCRYTRDAQMNILFICSNSSCRYVFNDE